MVLIKIASIVRCSYPISRRLGWSLGRIGRGWCQRWSFGWRCRWLRQRRNEYGKCALANNQLQIELLFIWLNRQNDLDQQKTSKYVTSLSFYYLIRGRLCRTGTWICSCRRYRRSFRGRYRWLCVLLNLDVLN